MSKNRRKEEAFEDTEEILETVPEIIEEEPKIVVEKQPVPEVQYQWDGVIREGLFAEILAANLPKEQEEEWVKKFASQGLAFRTILEPERTDTEAIIKYGINPQATWLQYLNWKAFLKK